MTRVALLTECKPYDASRTPEEHLISVGGNTGNNAYVTALMDIFGAKHINYGHLDRALANDEFDIYLVGNLSWIVENTAVPQFYIDAFEKINKKGKRLVPISVGTQVFDYKPDFKYHPKTLKLLTQIGEQAVIACRGDYTAEMLNKNGIKNVEVIGCPSLYHTKNPEFKLSKRNNLRRNAKIATGITPWPNKNMSAKMVKEFFSYASKNKVEFIEQANTNWIEFITKSDTNFEMLLDDYLKNYNKIFYGIDQWREYARELDFSFGGRFHGNVIPLLEGVPSLFITIDARTKEMCDYFKLPNIDIREFNFNSSIEELYDYTDYSEFNKNYKNAYEKFERFVGKNDLKIIY